MPETKHTPGPWKCEPSSVNDACYNVFNPDGDFLTIDDTEHEANANLIAAAPDMLVACELGLKAMETLARQSIKNGLLLAADKFAMDAKQIRAAIAKAKGATNGN